MSKRETILIADDAEINRAILRNLFEGEYNLLEAENGEQTLLLLRQYRESVAAILLDLIMPEKSGYEVLSVMQQEKLLYHTPVIVITSEDSVDSRVRVFELGASDIITKPFEAGVVKSRVNNIIELGRYRHRLETLVEEQSIQVRESNAAVIDMLSSVIEYRSLESGQHIRRIRMFTKILLDEVAKNFQEYGLDSRKVQLIAEASSMHDIGKIAIPDCILNKPGKLTPEEFEIMKTHTLKGCEILSGLDRFQDREYLRNAYQICRYHHERWDGNGYPDGLKESSIPICAQVVAIADCYDALTTDRVYKKAISSDRAFSMILNGECGAFSPGLLECFKNVRDSFARLSEEYADGRTPELDRNAEPAAEKRLWDAEEGVQEQGQLKYFALLRYLDSTVMEVDLQTGIYHLVYLQDRDFLPLRAGADFEESLRRFAEDAVHPDDRGCVFGLADGAVKRFFGEGHLRHEQRYRILNREKDAYVWCRCTMLRLNLENPRLQRVLFVWQKEETAPPVPNASEKEAARQNYFAIDQLFGGILKCVCDRYLTIRQVSHSLESILGYSEREIQENFENRLLNLIYPADRDKVIRLLRAQRDAGRLLDLEYRLMAKDGRVVWVSNRCRATEEDGQEVVLGVLIDITESRQAEEELRLSLERLNVIMTQANDIIFEWDICGDRLYLSSNWETQYGYAPIRGDVRREVLKASHIHPDDVPVFLSLMDAMTAGVPYKEGEFRILDAEGKYRWRRVRSTAQFDLDGKPFKAVGLILDIDAQRRASDELEERASRDVLTGLYNKMTAQAKMAEYLSKCGKEEKYALLILDVDDFKQINDQFGHMFGDAVLTEISAKLSGLFRAEDTIARIGGDEFLVFMPNIKQEEAAKRRAEQAIDALLGMLRENPGGVEFSCSIGLAFSSGRALTFTELFNRADRALYHAKSNGKKRCEVYTGEMGRSPFGLAPEAQTRRHTEIESDRSEQWNLPYLIMKTFDILYKEADFSQAVQSILKLSGEMFEVSRTYIFENSGDGWFCSNTFEWCAEGIEPQIQNLQMLPYLEEGHDYRDYFGEDGLFYCQNIRKVNDKEFEILDRQNILSTLQFAIRENGKFRGFVGFDDCKVRRLWTEEQINALTFIGKLMSVFLLKNRAQEEPSR